MNISPTGFKLVNLLVDQTILLTMGCHGNLIELERVFGQWNWQIEQPSGASEHCSYCNILFVHLKMNNQESC